MKIEDRFDRFRKCFRCIGRNTKTIGLAMDERYAIVYVGWCKDCLMEYSYREQVETIHDKEERI